MELTQPDGQASDRKKLLEGLFVGCGCMVGLCWLALMGGIVYVVVHFIVKYW